VASRSDEIRPDSVEHAGVTIAYVWCHSRRRTLGITVRPDRSVSVRVPLRTPVKEVRAFVTRRAEWIIKVWKKLDVRIPRQQQVYENGAKFLFQGKEYRLELETGRCTSLQLRDGLLVLTAPEMPAKDNIRLIIDNWYRKQSLEIMKERSIACHRMMAAEVIPLPPITIRTMKTRWGSYSYRTRRITLNLNLIKVPSACLDYVIIHELCHIKVRHHGPDFWQMVSQYVPDYLLLRNQLNRYVS